MLQTPLHDEQNAVSVEVEIAIIRNSERNRSRSEFFDQVASSIVPIIRIIQPEEFGRSTRFD